VVLAEFEGRRKVALINGMVDTQRQVRTVFNGASAGLRSALVRAWNVDDPKKTKLQTAMKQNTLDHWLLAQNQLEQSETGPLGAGPIGEENDYRLQLEATAVITGRGTFTVSASSATLEAIDGNDQNTETLRQLFAARPLSQVGIPVDVRLCVRDGARESDGLLQHHGNETAWQLDSGLVNAVGPCTDDYIRGLARIARVPAGCEADDFDALRQAAGEGARMVWASLAGNSLAALHLED
jgi:hypothetical protein